MKKNHSFKLTKTHKVQRWLVLVFCLFITFSAGAQCPPPVITTTTASVPCGALFDLSPYTSTCAGMPTGWRENGLPVSSPLIATPGTHVYVYEVYNAAGCLICKTEVTLNTIVINPPPIKQPFFIQCGQSVNVNELTCPGATMSWTDSLGNPVVPPFSPTATTKYYGVGKDLNGCPVCAYEVNVTVNYTTHYMPIGPCVETSYNLNSVCPGANNYTWTLNGSPISGSGAAQIIYDNHNPNNFVPDDGDIYRSVTTDPQGCLCITEFVFDMPVGTTTVWVYSCGEYTFCMPGPGDIYHYRNKVNLSGFTYGIVANSNCEPTSGASVQVPSDPITHAAYNGVYEFFYEWLDSAGTCWLREKYQVNIMNCPHRPVGLKEIGDPASEFVIYPQPNSGKFQIKTTQTGARIQITDLLGRIVLTDKIITSFETDIDISKEKSGFYFIRITDGSKSSIQKIWIE